MACQSLYTDQELIDKIKEIDENLLSGVSSTSLDTSQSKHDIRISVQTLQRQREYYLSLLWKQNPAQARCIDGDSAIQFRSCGSKSTRYRGY